MPIPPQLPVMDARLTDASIIIALGPEIVNSFRKNSLKKIFKKSFKIVLTNMNIWSILQKCSAVRQKQRTPKQNQIRSCGGIGIRA